MYRVLRTTFSDFVTDDCPRMAAALAFYTTFSLAPLLILAMAIAGLVFDPADVAGEVDQQLANAIGAEGTEQLREMLREAKRPEFGSVASIWGVIGLLVGATGVVAQLQIAINDAWGVTPDPKKSAVRAFMLKRLFSLAMVLSLGFVLAVSLVIGSVMRALDARLGPLLPDETERYFPVVLNTLVTFVILIALFAAMFKIIPDAKVAWRDTAVGALVTAVLFLLGKYALAIYLGTQDLESSFGAAGSFALILLWTYYSAMILLLGAEFTHAWALHRGRGIEPVAGAVRVAKP